ncbi:MAG: 23S rRNA (adenine(2030)-N(6))-methyltransferase RlmJ [Steroidobacteraceae bacterium]
MKYRHAFHAGNFADVHKHVTLLALLAALQRKDKGFLYLETHAGSGAYDGTAQAAVLESLLRGATNVPELNRYVRAITAYRAERGKPQGYAGSPLLAARELRPQDRAVLIEAQLAEARALERALDGIANARVETADGFAQLRAHLPPKERRGLVFIDPPYEETEQDFDLTVSATREALRRFETCVVAVWYPIKKAADLEPWYARIAGGISHETLLSELWLYPTDSRVSLNGSGLVIVNPPYQIAERMQMWLPELAALLDAERRGGAKVRWLTPPR